MPDLKFDEPTAKPCIVSGNTALAIWVNLLFVVSQAVIAMFNLSTGEGSVMYPLGMVMLAFANLLTILSLAREAKK